MDSKFTVETDILEVLARGGIGAARKEVLLRIQKVKEEILELCLANHSESLCTADLNNLVNDRPQVPPGTVEWLTNNWETIISAICETVIPQNLVTESSIVMYDRCISTLLLAVGAVLRGSIVTTHPTVSHLSKALSVLTNRVTSGDQQELIPVLGIFSEAFHDTILRIQEVPEDLVAGSDSDASKHPLHSLKESEMYLSKLRLHNKPFITRADDSYGALYRLVEWGDNSPALLTAVCSNIYLSLCPLNDCA